MSERRVNLSEEDIKAKIRERNAKLAQQRASTIGGLIAGIAGIVFAFVALLVFESITFSSLGFAVMGLGFGLVTPEQLRHLWKGKDS
jgi:hypothetical protein